MSELERIRRRIRDRLILIDMMQQSVDHMPILVWTGEVKLLIPVVVQAFSPFHLYTVWKAGLTPTEAARLLCKQAGQPSPAA